MYAFSGLTLLNSKMERSFFHQVSTLDLYPQHAREGGACSVAHEVRIEKNVRGGSGRNWWSLIKKGMGVLEILATDPEFRT